MQPYQARSMGWAVSNKHIAYYRILEAFDAPGCPICRLLEQDARSSIKWTLYEHVNDSDIRQELVASRGYCKEHSDLLIELGHPLGVAIIYRDIIDAATADLQSGAVLRRNRRGSKSRSQCPICKSVKGYLDRCLGTLTDNYGDDEMRSRLLSCRDLCIPHVELLLDRLPPNAQQELRQAALSHLGELKAELSEIIRKSDYRCEEPWGEEGNAWTRAVKRLSGHG